MAVGPTGSQPFLPTPSGAGNQVARLARGLQEALWFQDRRGPAFEAVLRAEPLDDPTDRRQFHRELTADDVRRLNPNVPRGTILDITV